MPLNAQYRNPTPGGADPSAYTDPVTAPAGDIANNPYWKRDVRRAYPRISTVTQSDIAGLLTLGSAAVPKQELIGDKGSETMALVRKESEEKGLAGLFEKDKGAMGSVLGEGGMPPFPTGLNSGTLTARRYVINDGDEGFPGK